VFGRGNKGLSIRNVTLKLPSSGVKLPPPVAMLGACYSVLGIDLAVPVNYVPSPGVEVRVHTSVTNDPRISKAKSYIFIGDTAVFKERAGTYEVVMPPSHSSADNITKALGRVLINAVRWERVMFFIAQFPSTAFFHTLFTDKGNVKGLKRPWGKPDPAGMPPADTIVDLGQGVRYGDVVSIHDGVAELGLIKESPEYELGYVVYDDDLVTVAYVVNPARVSVAFRRVSGFDVRHLKDVLGDIDDAELRRDVVKAGLRRLDVKVDVDVRSPSVFNVVARLLRRLRGGGGA